jgi:hypothetical protein
MPTDRARTPTSIVDDLHEARNDPAMREAVVRASTAFCEAEAIVLRAVNDMIDVVYPARVGRVTEFAYAASLLEQLNDRRLRDAERAARRVH